MQMRVSSPTRVALEAKAGAHIQVIATFLRVGARRSSGAPDRTVLVRDVRDATTGELLSDHLWFNRGQTRWKANLRAGDVITFVARSIEYRSGYWGPNRVRQIETPARRDFRLTPPEGLVLVATGFARIADAA